MDQPIDEHVVTLDPDQPVFESVFTVSPLVIVGTVEPDDQPNLAPKHMATPLGWDQYFGFVCTEEHATYRNIRRNGTFTVSYPRPEQIVTVSLSASTRTEENQKPELEALDTLPASRVEGVFVRNAYLYLECELEKIYDDFGDSSLIAGRIVVGHAHEDALRGSERDELELLHGSPLLAYLHPGRFAGVSESRAFPFPRGFLK